MQPPSEDLTTLAPLLSNLSLIVLFSNTQQLIDEISGFSYNKVKTEFHTGFHSSGWLEDVQVET